MKFTSHLAHSLMGIMALYAQIILKVGSRTYNLDHPRVNLTRIDSREWQYNAIHKD
ncbi:hypothetical protein KAZ92_00245 [Candidatus Gracilibacteria bacterium]|nr:hypothetical protein [Candidatus Gracilibacteria bacterium]